ncbi:MAG: enoyl-CoA hydratase-related protein [Pseudomonadota bacterium]
MNNSYSTLVLDMHDGVAAIRLNRPERRNALTEAMLGELLDAFQSLAEALDVHAIALLGNGAGFCAGQDLSERDPRGRDQPFDLEAKQRELYHPIIACMQDMKKPVVAGVHGVAAGAGVGIALAADIAVAARNAKFVFSFAKVGLSVDAGVGWHLTKALGPAKAKALLMTGGMLDGQSAARSGLVWDCVADGELEATVLELAGQLARGPQTALGCIKQTVQTAQEEATLASYLAEEARLQGIAGRDPDYREGVLSFLEKRPTRFGGQRGDDDT